MNGGSSIVGLRAGDTGMGDHTALLSHLDRSEVEAGMDDDTGYVAASSRHWLVPALVAALVATWIGASLWFARAALPMLAPVALIELIAAIVIVPAAIGIVWLLALRNSRSESRRFGHTAAAMRAEAASLERTVAALSASIEASRAGLATQAAALATMGDAAIGRLAEVGQGLTREIGAADDHARTLAAAADAAQGSLSTLLAALPHARAETDAARQLLDQTGLSAAEHAAALDAQLVALADRGREAEVVAGGAAQKLAAHITRMDATSESAGQRLESVTAEMARAVDALLDRTAQAVDESRKGIAAQGDAMLAMVGVNQAALASAARDSAEALAERIGATELVIDRIAERLATQRQAGGVLVDGLEQGIAHVGDRLDALHHQGVERSQVLAASISALGGSADAMTAALRAGDAMATHAIGTAETLLIALDSAAREIDETLPDALDRLDSRVGASQRVVSAAKPELLALVTAAESSHDAIEAIAQVIAQQRITVDQLSGTLLATLDTGRSRADAIGKVVDDTVARTNRFADEAAPRLIDALLRVRDTATTAADQAREMLAALIPEAADALEGAGTEALRRATTATVDRQLVAIAGAADGAVAATARASERLEQQLRAIADTTALVDARLEDARAEREEADHDSLTRRVSLLIESLNSASIDITRSFSPEVSDSAWAAYLKGDRGVFTRRAVRLLDGNEARDIARLYDADPAFREQVNRYIHDFEAMLRAILTQREGTHLGVTLLSSDMGKLYVALAQAIERLR